MTLHEVEHNFAVNLNPVFDKQKLRQLVVENSHSVFEYVEHSQDAITKQLAEEFPVRPNNIYVGAGATEILFTLPRALQKNEAVVPIPTFWEFIVANQRAEKQLIFVPNTKENGFNLNIPHLSQVITQNSAIYLCNPNNPTAVLYDSQDLASLLVGHPKSDFVVDETYLLFRPDYEHKSLVKLVNDNRNLYLVTSLSKFFHIPGLRVGLLMSHEENIRRFRTVTTPYLRSSFVDAVVPTLLADHDYNALQRQTINNLREQFSARLQEELSPYIHVYPSAANFILIELPPTSDSTQISQKLLEKGYKVRDGSEFVGLGNKWLRISVQTAQENESFVRIFKQVLQS